MLLNYTDSYGETYQVKPTLNTYLVNSNLYVGLEYLDQECNAWLPYADVTVNIDSLPFLESAIDTNNNGPNILAFLTSNGFGSLTGYVQPSGLCAFPVFRFNADKLKEIDAEIFTEYEKAVQKRDMGLQRSPMQQLRDEQAAWKIGEDRFLALQTCDDGYDYTIYDQDYREVDGGQLDNPELSLLAARDEIILENDLAGRSLQAFDYDELAELADEAWQKELAAVARPLDEVIDEAAMQGYGSDFKTSPTKDAPSELEER